MLGTTRLINNTSAKNWNLRKVGDYVSDLSTLPSQTNCSATSDLVFMEEDINQQLRNIPNTIISFQYDNNEFLTFRVCKVKDGEIVKSGNKFLGLQCRIGNKTYTLKREHLNQMSERECQDLFNYLGVNSSQLVID